jgi:hypothetical protein
MCKTQSRGLGAGLLGDSVFMPLVLVV